MFLCVLILYEVMACTFLYWLSLLLLAHGGQFGIWVYETGALFTCSHVHLSLMPFSISSYLPTHRATLSVPDTAHSAPHFHTARIYTPFSAPNRALEVAAGEEKGH